ncbi:unnamed protein product [Microthlaspi erraticum]|uniref:F-box domain-containing protein n=1 Tax=Microthlaspi erraticum TaxID=1685480 RepID=A0A6D2JDG6_9BRAS|nr:unnamed protein product [Microthlaspi erraticum]CAA7060183.1 unnamed protein product [Microthlaspi erraticum]
MSSKNKAEVEQSSESPFVIMSLPEDVMVKIIARVPRCEYLTLSFVSKHFRSLVASPMLYASRSLLGLAEQCLYVLLTNDMTCDERWYTLCRKPYGNRGLVLIPSLPAMPCHGRFVSVGSKVYVFSGSYNHHKPQDVLSIDCRSHTVQTLPSMPIHMTDTVAGFIDGKIYVIGYSYIYKGTVMVVFNTETLMWEPEMTKQYIDLSDTEEPSYVVVMGNKIYTPDNEDDLVFKPVESTWESIRSGMLNYENWENTCVVDDVLYCYVYQKHLRMYDPNKRCWGVVNGLEDLWAKTKWSERRSMTLSYGGKLALFFTKLESGEKRQIWCAEISLERRQGGEIWGKVEWCGEVLSSGDLSLSKALAVML